MPDKKFDLGSYIEVKDRIARFYELFGQGRLVTGEVRLTTDPDGKPRVLVQAAAYRTPDDPLPGIGWSWMELPGTTPYTKGSELENTETSAWGRAIAALGILVDTSIASAQEVANKQDGAQPPRAADPDGLTGTVEVGDKATSDFELRQGPDGDTIGFRLVSPRGKILLRAYGPLATELRAYKDQVASQRVTAWGSIDTVTETIRGADRSWQVLTATRIRVPGLGDLPLPAEPLAADTPPLTMEQEAELDRLFS